MGERLAVRTCYLADGAGRRDSWTGEAAIKPKPLHRRGIGCFGRLDHEKALAIWRDAPVHWDYSSNVLLHAAKRVDSAVNRSIVANVWCIRELIEESGTFSNVCGVRFGTCESRRITGKSLHQDDAESARMRSVRCATEVNSVTPFAGTRSRIDRTAATVMRRSSLPSAHVRGSNLDKAASGWPEHCRSVQVRTRRVPQNRVAVEVCQ